MRGELAWLTDYSESFATIFCCAQCGGFGMLFFLIFYLKTPRPTVVTCHVGQRHSHQTLYVGIAQEGLRGFSLPFKNMGLEHVLSPSSF